MCPRLYAGYEDTEMDLIMKIPCNACYLEGQRGCEQAKKKTQKTKNKQTNKKQGWGKGNK